MGREKMMYDVRLKKNHITSRCLNEL
jgi:hypothetical protein